MTVDEIEEVITKNRRGLHVYLSRLGYNDVDIEDALGEMFCRWLRSPERIQINNETKYAFVYKAARNAMIDQLKKKKAGLLVSMDDALFSYLDKGKTCREIEEFEREDVISSFISDSEINEKETEAVAKWMEGERSPLIRARFYRLRLRLMKRREKLGIIGP